MHNPLTPAFTLIEFLIVLALLTCLLTLSLPIQKRFFQPTYSTTLRTQLFQSLQTARSDAILNSTQVSVCKSQDGKQCNGEWNNGQLVFVDKFEDGVIHEPHQVISYFKMPKNKGQIHWRHFSHHRWVEFFPDGSINAENGTFWYCAEDEKFAEWALVINKAGRIREVLPDKGGKVRDGKGVVLGC